MPVKIILRLVAFIACANSAAAQQSPNAEGEQLFTKHVNPLLVAKCQGCHGQGRISGLSVLSREDLVRGGKRGAAVVPGVPAKSLLISSIEQTGDLKMPPGQKLSEAEIAALRRWVELGASWTDTPATTPQSTTEGDDIWAFRPVRHYDPPRLKQPAQSANPIDAFILRKLQDRNIRPAPASDRATLIRRATLDLIGVPPTPEEVTEFVHDPAPDREAFAKTVERLLASPRYGERWGRHWLDVARYADTSGYSNDFERPSAWRYREYVIRSFNQDKPYDEFIREQLAGDEIDPKNPEYLAATGFLRMGPWEHTAMSVAAETRQLWLDDVTHTTGAAFLGVTVECARCHDHKFDPLPTKDYYSLQAIFATTEFAERPAPFLASELRDSFAAGREALEQLIRRNDERIQQFDELVKQRLAAKRGLDSPQQLTQEEVKAALLKKDLMTGDEMERQKIFLKRKELYARSIERYSPVAHSVSDGPFAPKARQTWSPPETFVLPVGNLQTPGERVMPAVFYATGKYGNEPAPAIDPNGIARRLALANWIADARNPLTARVMANRIWGYHFGTGIAATPNDLGKMGKRPTHPELLDYLAEYFVQHGWSIKAMHRIIMASDVYQRGPLPADAQSREADKQNKLLAYFPPRRMEAEELRDSILAVSGELSRNTGGPGTFPEINRDVATQSQQIMGTLMPAYRPSAAKDDRHRRTIYTFQKRNLPDPFLDVFNGPSLDASTDRRLATTIPTQVYALFNSQFMHDMALAFADRIARVESDRDGRIRLTFLRAYQRAPSLREVTMIRAQYDKLLNYHRRTAPPAKPVRKPLVRGITSELTGAEVRIEEEEDLERYQENLQPADVSPETRALADVALALFNTNEFIYVY